MFTMSLYCTNTLYTFSHTVSTNQNRLWSPNDWDDEQFIEEKAMLVKLLQSLGAGGGGAGGAPPPQ